MKVTSRIEPVPKPPITVTIELNREEAELLKLLIGAIEGRGTDTGIPPNGRFTKEQGISIRLVTDDLYKKLDDCL